MDSKIFELDKWQLQATEDQIGKKSEPMGEEKKNEPYMWYNTSKSLSPLSLYTYLKARFGAPNGFIMYFKDKSSDNLIHWHYSLKCPEGKINILGKTSGIEIGFYVKSTITITDSDWQVLINNFQQDYRKYSVEMKKVQSEFEHWALFINPFLRIEQTLQEYVDQIEKLDLTEFDDYTLQSSEEFNKYQDELKRWTSNMSKAASLGTTIRMLCPVMAESFVNLVILVFRKDEYKRDDRLYESLIRQQIDIRVKSLHLHCICFPNQIDSSSDAFKEFHTLMNNRNDFLHGNIDPNKLIVEDVWFDDKTIPLFKKDEGIIKKMMRNYCMNVERSKAIADFQTISNFIELILMSMDKSSLLQFVQLMSDRMPGINKKTKRLGALLPSDHLVEGHVVLKSKKTP